MVGERRLGLADDVAGVAGVGVAGVAGVGVGVAGVGVGVDVGMGSCEEGMARWNMRDERRGGIMGSWRAGLKCPMRTRDTRA